MFDAMKMHVVSFWVVMPWSDMEGYQRFGWPCCLHLQDELTTTWRVILCLQVKRN